MAEGRDAAGSGESGRYRVPAAPASGELRERGSRFLAVVWPASSTARARRELDALGRAHAGATHLCWAWRIGWPPSERWSDAGEPHGTAGMPILRALRGAGLSDVVAGVVRWYGGTKLGKGGLARAYAGAARAAIEGLPTADRRPTARLVVEAGFDRLGAVQRLVQPPAVRVVEEEYGATARLVLEVELTRRDALLDELAGLGVGCSREGTDS